MASVTDICNIGLGHIGARAQITSIDPVDGSVESGYCARFYPIARKELIEAGNFSFTKHRVELAEVTNTSDVWRYAYALPADCVMPLRVLELQYVLDLPVSGGADWCRDGDPLTEMGSAVFEVEAGVLRTNEPEAVLLYKRDVTDTTKFTPLFVSTMGMLMASYLAGPIVKGLDGAKVGASWREAAYGMAAKAIAADGNAGRERGEHVAAHLCARN